MSSQSCTACNDLREYAPDFVLNGVNDDTAEYLEKNQGLSGEEDHTDCTDLLDVNDCLIGNMITELDSYDVCEWKDFMSALLGNMYETFKAIIYSDCGQWCALNALTNGAKFKMTEDSTGDAYVVAGKGVSFLTADSGNATQVRISYIAGGLARLAGSYKFYSDDWTETKKVVNFDNGDTESTSASRKGNEYWNKIATNTTWMGGELISEFRIKRSAYPEIGTVFSGFGQETSGGSYSVYVQVFEEGKTAWGQHGKPGASSTIDGTTVAADAGHTVPSGWLYIQLRMQSAASFGATSGGRQYSPGAFMGMRMNLAELDCYVDQEEEESE